jgi:hypothetical protein
MKPTSGCCQRVINSLRIQSSPFFRRSMRSESGSASILTCFSTTGISNFPFTTRALANIREPTQPIPLGKSTGARIDERTDACANPLGFLRRVRAACRYSQLGQIFSFWLRRSPEQSTTSAFGSAFFVIISRSQGSLPVLRRPALARKASSPNRPPSAVGASRDKHPVYSFWLRRFRNS